MADEMADLSRSGKRALAEQLLRERALREKQEGPLSYGQRALWAIQQGAPDSVAYNTAWSARIRSPLDVPLLERSCQALVQRHASLRTTFRETAGGVVQEMRGYQPVDFRLVHAPSSATEDDLRALVVSSYREPFDLERGPLCRVRLFSRGDADHILLLTIHHIVCDAWSIWLLVDELGERYAAGRDGRQPAARAAAAQYGDFVAWQEQMVRGAEGDGHLRYWSDRLAGDLPQLDLAPDRPRPRVLSPAGGSHAFDLDAVLTAALKTLAARAGVTLFTALTTAFQALLHRYTGQPEIVVGSPVAGRSRPEFASTVGYFVNPVALRLEVPAEATFADLLRANGERVLDALTHQDYPFPLLVERLQPRRDGSRSPIFQALFVLQTPSGRAWDGLSVEPYEIPQMEGQFELALEIIQAGGGLHAILKYASDLFDADTAARMARHLELLLRAIVLDSSQRVRDIPLLSDAERHQLVATWNSTAVPFDQKTLLHEHIERQALRTPDAVAVTFEGAASSYRELNAASNRLAHALRRMGVAPDRVVGIRLERSIEMVVALLAVLKAGGAYLPLDPEYPAERLAFMQHDSHCALVLTPDVLAALLAAPAVSGESDRSPSSNPGAPVDPDNLAYVIYTSGSTGAPKGVMTTHRAICNRLLWMQDAYRLDGSDCVLQKTPFSFDVSVWEFFWPLMTGARLAVARPGGHRDSAYLARTIARERVTTAHFVPSMLQIFVEERGLDRCASLKRVICSGEVLPADLQARVLATLPVELHNLYGPTEAAVDVTAWRCVADELGETSPERRARRRGGPAAPLARSVPIGRPIANTQVYVLDAAMRPAPVGVPGELHLGGVNLARGYVQRPDLTAERFVPSPFRAGDRLYRTGDVCRYRPDGTVEYLGRQDQQVKIRGFRIELGEIESVLARHPDVRESAVVVDGDSDPRLVAFVASREGFVGSGAVQEFARARLPEHMVPSAIVSIEKLPLLPNGKLDRAALQRLASRARRADQPRDAHGSAPTAPRSGAGHSDAGRSDAERRIAAIWCELLGREQVGVDEHFFEIGGHSLLAIRLLRRLEETFAAGLSVTDIFQYPTVAALARRLVRETDPAHSRGPASASWVSASAGPTSDDQVAVIGMACRFPGAPDVDTFWRNLRDGVESIVRFSDEELAAAGVDAALMADPAYVRARAVLADVEYFDAEFFGFSPREAAVLDVQHRLFLECAWEALEDAGYDGSRYLGSIGVYAGAGLNSYLLHNVFPNREAVRAVGPFQVMISNDKDYLPTRVSYALDLRGPSVSVQSACSTSLVAIHLACRALLGGECDMALGGAVSIPIPQVAGYRHQDGMILSPDGHCRPFDARAAGTVGGSGVGVVLLKRLSRAIVDGDRIVGVIRGTAINNDGRAKVGYTAPSVEGQQAVIAQALARAGVEADSIGYIEAHGTGTALGDPIEARALARVFGQRGQGSLPCVIGSVKSNVGHLDTAAGMAGLIKALLALQHRAIPPTLHFERINPALELDAGRFEVNTALRGWPSGGTSRRAGVSAFGIGGTNAHVVLEEAPRAAPSIGGSPWQLLVLSARTPSALDAATDRLAGHLRLNPDAPLADVAHTLQIGRRQFEHRRAVACGSVADAVAALDARVPSEARTWHEPRPSPARAWAQPGPALTTGMVHGATPSVAFMFPGQGAQYAGMGAGLYRSEPVFRAHVDACAELLAPHLGLDLRPLIYEKDDEAALRATSIAQPALFVTEYALARWWMACGVVPDALIGHSVGEYVAASIAGVFSLEDALRLVAARGRLLQALPAGSMLAVAWSAEMLQPLLADRLSLAAINGPESCVASGPSAAIDALEQEIRRRGGVCQPLQTSHAFHSPMMDAALEAFAEEIGRTRRAPPQVPIVSNVTGTWLTAEEAIDATYWVRHLRHTVRFSDGVRTLRQPGRLLLEVGPGQTLTALASPPAQPPAISSMRHRYVEVDDGAALLTAVGRLWVAGVDIDWAAIHAGAQRKRAPLPTYPFERQRYWIDPPPAFPAQERRHHAPDRSDDIERWFSVPSWRRAPLPAARDEHPTAWLAFVDEAGFGADLVRELRTRGDRVVAVTPGDRFARVAHDRYAIRPGEREDYERLVHAVHADPGELPRGILHGWCLTSPGGDGAAALDPLDRAFFSLVFLAQALDAVDEARFEVSVVSSRMQAIAGEDALDPSAALLLGPVRVIPLEYAHIACRSIDVSPGQGPAAIVNELDAFGSDAVVAYRDGQRWICDHAPVTLPAAASPIRRGGVYLITGGRGGIGLALAEHLARTYSARLVLVGRSPVDEARRRELDHQLGVDVSGGRVIYATADVTDRRRMREVVAEALSTFGEISGVIHAAGIAAGGMVQRKTKAMVEPVMAPKVDGVRVLDEVLRGLPIDFCVLMSSVTGLVGGFGQVDYAAANAFLDAFAHARHREGAPWLAIDWDTWRDVGMAVHAALPGDLDARRVEQLAAGIPSADGVAAFLRALSSGLSQVTVSPRDVRTRGARPERAVIQPDVATAAPHERPVLRSAYAAPASDTERDLEAMWRLLLGIDRIGARDDFFELGGHSLLATQLLTRIRDAFSIRLALSAIFEAPTIAQLAERVDTARLAQADAETLERILREVKGSANE